MDLIEWLKAYRDLGYFGLWIATLIVMYKDQRKERNEQIKLTIQITNALDKSTSAINDSTSTSKQLISEVNSLKVGNENFVAFLKGRDDGRRDR